MPLFHSFAIAMGLHLAAYAAGTLVILPRYRPDWLIDAITRHGATRLPAARPCSIACSASPGCRATA